MSLCTNWVCFNCCKSFHRRPLEYRSLSGSMCDRKCPNCTQPIVDMGVYFEPPPRRATKQWEMMQLLARNGYRFHSEGSKVYIKAFILQTKRPRIADVRNTILLEKLARAASRTKQRLEYYKND